MLKVAYLHPQFHEPPGKCEFWGPLGVPVSLQLHNHRVGFNRARFDPFPALTLHLHPDALKPAGWPGCLQAVLKEGQLWCFLSCPSRQGIKQRDPFPDLKGRQKDVA